MKDTEKTFCSIIIDVIIGHGVREIVCSPGTRNAPLLIAAAAREEVRKHTVIDERSAAFMALGLSMSSQQPVALICTSGTAMLNYSPAVAEAYYQGIPLIVITADRPRQWIDQDDSQTLRQFEALGNYVKKSYDVPSWGDENQEMQWYVNRIVNDAMIEAVGGKPGPVHINIALKEPLSGKIDRNQSEPRLITRLQADSFANKSIFENLAEEVAHSRVFFVAGFMPPDSGMNRAVSSFCRLPNVVAMTETVSNLHLGHGSCEIDAVLTAYHSAELDRFAPDLIISVGGALVSRKLKEYLRRNSSHCRHWSLGRTHTTVDCFQSMTQCLEVEPVRFLRYITPLVRKRLSQEVDNFSEDWNKLRQVARETKQSFLNRIEWSDMMAVRMVLNNLPAKSNLFLSNGTCVRYAQILCDRLPHASWCNRGVAGIDGCTSTAVGCAKNYKEKTVLLTGDMSMSYDIGALALPEIPRGFKIVVLDNSGGGIFRFIATTSRLEEREQYFCVPPKLPLRQLAEGYGFNYVECDGIGNVEKIIRDFLHCDGNGILKLTTPPDYSGEILRDYMRLKTETTI